MQRQVRSDEAGKAPSISQQARRISLEFDDLCRSIITGGNTRQDVQGLLLSERVEDETERFRQWAGNLGAFHGPSDTRSLDYRLRSQTKVTERAHDLLETLRDLLQIAAGAPVDTQGDSTHNDDSEYTGPDDDELLVLELAGFDTSEECKDSSLIASISDTISHLFRLSSRLAKSTTRDRWAKAQSAKLPKFDDTYDIAHALEKFASCQDHLVLFRLAQANVQRRQYILYCREHRDKLAAVSTRGAARQADVSLRALDCSRIDGALPPERALQKGTSHTSAVQTTASTLGPVDLNAFDDGFDDSRSKSTLATSLGQSPTIDVLRVPELGSISVLGELFECPYCYTFQRFNGQTAWRAHVFADIRPYVCTFSDCGMLVFESKRAWVDHEMEAHRRTWTCPGCPYTTGRDSGSLKGHLEQQHRDIATNLPLKALLKSSSRPLEILAAKECPLCDWGEELRSGNTHVTKDDDVTVTAPQFMRHLAGHLEQLALFALPRPVENEEGEGASIGVAFRSRENSTDAMSEYTLLGHEQPEQDQARSLEQQPRSQNLLTHEQMMKLSRDTAGDCEPAANTDSWLRRGRSADSHLSKAMTEADFLDSTTEVHCICARRESDGNLVTCDSCGRWQHINCYYPQYAGRDLPAGLKHFCMDCHPRYISGSAYRVTDDGFEKAPAETIKPPKKSSYWSKAEQTEFVKLIERFGTDFKAIALHLTTKSQRMIENRYRRLHEQQESHGDRQGEALKRLDVQSNSKPFSDTSSQWQARRLVGPTVPFGFDPGLPDFDERLLDKMAAADGAFVQVLASWDKEPLLGTQRSRAALDPVPQPKQSTPSGHSAAQSFFGKPVESTEVDPAMSDVLEETVSNSEDEDVDAQEDRACFNAKFERQKRALEARIADLSARDYRATTPLEKIARLACISVEDLQWLQEQQDMEVD